MTENSRKRLVLAITGASGAAYALRLLQTLLDAGVEVHAVASPAGEAVVRHETGVVLPPAPGEAAVPTAGVSWYTADDFTAPIASGSFRTSGMVICPCSNRTLGAIASGGGDHLIHRAADVHLKERRPLVLVIRETPLSLIQIDNMRRVTEAGAVVLPASPGFYHRPSTVEQMVDFVVARICDALGVPHSLSARWGDES